ncbi:MAG TPA: response regulator [Opitutaceae bacterium]|nr:response regulator [Opitutaceae bacterium]
MNAKVLLVDDEPTVLACVSAALSRFGYSVTTANSGEAALSRLERHPFDLVITDFRMPGVNGAAVVEAVRERQEDAAILLITGLSEELPAWLRTGPAAVRILTKPFLLTQLRAEAETALRARTALAV